MNARDDQQPSSPATEDPNHAARSPIRAQLIDTMVASHGQAARHIEGLVDDLSIDDEAITAAGGHVPFTRQWLAAAYGHHHRLDSQCIEILEDAYVTITPGDITILDRRRYDQLHHQIATSYGTLDHDARERAWTALNCEARAGWDRWDWRLTALAAARIGRLDDSHAAAFAATWGALPSGARRAANQLEGQLRNLPDFVGRVLDELADLDVAALTAGTVATTVGDVRRSDADELPGHFDQIAERVGRDQALLDVALVIAQDGYTGNLDTLLDVAAQLTS